MKGSAYGTTLTEDYLTAVSRGDIAGKSSEIVVGINNKIGKVFEDLWGPGAIQIWPTSAESLELVSTSNGDSPLGGGIATVLVRGLDADYVEQDEIVTMTGTIPSVLTKTYLRTRIILALTNGIGVSARNLGTITLQVVGGGPVRQLMEADCGSSFSSHYTVPSGKTAQLLQATPAIPKNTDVTMRTVLRGEAPNAAEVVGVNFHIYQASVRFPVVTPLSVPEKADLKLQVSSSNAGATVTVFEEFLLTDK